MAYMQPDSALAMPPDARQRWRWQRWRQWCPAAAATADAGSKPWLPSPIPFYLLYRKQQPHQHILSTLLPACLPAGEVRRGRRVAHGELLRHG